MVTGHYTSHLGLELGVHISCYFLVLMKCCKSLSSHKTHLGCIKKYPHTVLYLVSTCLHPHSVLCEEPGMLCWLFLGTWERFQLPSCAQLCLCFAAPQKPDLGPGSCPGQLRWVIITPFLCWEQVKRLPVHLKERRKPWWGGTVRNHCVYTVWD